jgi:superfamily II DNA or RNA helicase
VTRVDSLKPPYVAGLIVAEAADAAAGGRGLQTLVWTVYDAETEILADLLAGAPFAVEALTGRTPKRERPAIVERFRTGRTRVLLARASMLGYGMNFQFAKAMVFNGWGFSYEQYYQAVRRLVRYGQADRVRVHVPLIPELEGQMWEAIGRKGRQHEEAIAEMEANYIRARAAMVAAGGERIGAA